MTHVPDDILAAAAHGLRLALQEAAEDPGFGVRVSKAADRGRAEDARLDRLVAIGEAVEAAVDHGFEVRVGDGYAWSASELLACLRRVGS